MSLVDIGASWQSSLECSLFLVAQHPFSYVRNKAFSANEPLPYKEEDKTLQREKEQTEELLPEAHSVEDKDCQAERKSPDGVVTSVGQSYTAVIAGNSAE